MSEELEARLEKLRRLRELQTGTAERTAPVGSFIDKTLPVAKDIGGFALDSAKMMGQGALNAQNSILSMHPILGPLAKMGMTALSGETPEKTIQDIRPVPPEESGAELYWRKAMGGAGAALGLDPKHALASFLTGSASGMGGEVGRRLGKDTKIPGMETAGEFAGSFATGAPTGFGLYPKQTPAQQDVREALQGIDKKGWQRALQNVTIFNNAGAKTATTAEAFPANSGVMDLAREARSRKIDNPLKTRVQNRDLELEKLGNSAMDAVNPPIGVADTANRLSTAANTSIDELYRLNTEATGNRLAGKIIPPRQAQDIITALQAKAQQFDKTGPATAKIYREVADALLQGDKKTPITDLQGISYQLKDLKNQPVNPAAGPGTKGTDAKYRQAIGLAEELLGQRSRAFRESMEDFGQFAAYTDTVKEGPIGRLSDRNVAGPDAPTPMARLDTLTSGNAPGQITGTMRELSDPGIVGQDAVNPREIARALMQKRLEAGKTNPGTAIRGTQGSDKNRQFQELIKSTGVDPAKVNTPLQAADQLQGFSGAAGLKQMPEMQWQQLFLRPFRTADMMLTSQGMKGIEQEIAQLLTGSSPPNPRDLRRLQEIAQFDPNVRKMLSAVIPFMAIQGNKEGK